MCYNISGLAMKRILLLTSVFLLATLNLAWAGLVSKGMEISLGKKFAAALEKEYKAYEEPRVTTIGKRLVEVCYRKDLDYSFKVLDIDEVNACSVGGGFIYINKGMLDYVKDDNDSLAYVIAHELAHITQRHMAKAMEQEMVGELLLNIILHSAGASENAYRITAVGWDLLLNGYSRKDEFEADRVGVEYMIKAGYNPEGALKIINRFIKAGDTDAGLLDLLRSHPPATQRGERIKTNFAAELNFMKALTQIDLLKKAPGKAPILPDDSLESALENAKEHTANSSSK
jgi:predicted Zn-dependent protease